MSQSLRKCASGIILASLLSACNGNLATSELIEQARNHLQKGEISEATIQLKNALKNEPDSIQARLMLADIYLEQGSWLNAAKELRKSQTPDQPLPNKYQLKLAKAYFFSGDSKALTEMAEKRSSLAAEERLVLYVYTAISLLQSNRLQEGDSYLLRAQEISQGAAFSDLGLAYKDALAENYQQALNSIESLMQRSPDLDAALSLKASLLSALGQYTQAADAFKQFLDKYPKAHQQRLLYASTLLASGQTDKAKAEIKSLLAINPGHPFVNQMNAELLYQDKQYEQAKLAAERAINGGLANTKNHLIAGVSALNLGQQEQAYYHIQQVEQNLPANHNLLKILAELKLKLGYVDEVTAMLSHVSPDSPADALLYSNTSLALARQGKLDEAQHFAAIAEGLAPEDSQVVLQRGLLKLVSKDDSALEDVTRALSLDPTNSSALVALVRSQIDAQQYEQAEASIQQAEQADPTILALLSGYLHKSQQQPEKARSAYQKALETDPDNLGAKVNLAMLDELQGKHEQALEQYGKLFQQYPSHWGLMKLLDNSYLKYPELRPKVRNLYEQYKGDNPANAIKLSVIQQREGEPEAALATINNAMQQFSGNSQLLNRLGNLQLEQKSYADAVTSYDSSLEKRPNQPMIWLKQIAALEAQGLINSAFTALQRGRRETNSAPVLDLTEVSLYLSENNLEKAASLLDTLQPQFGHVLGYHFLAARLAKKRGDTELQVQHSEVIFTRFPNLTNGKALITAYIAHKDYDKAMALANQFEQKLPNNHGLKLAKADILLRTDHQAAIAYYEELARVPEPNPIVLNNLAHLYLSDKAHYQDAIKLSQRALEIVPNHPAIRETLAHAYLKSGNAGQAASLYKELVPKHLNTPEIQLRYIKALIESGNQALAQELILQLDRARLTGAEDKQLSALERKMGKS